MGVCGGAVTPLDVCGSAVAPPGCVWGCADPPWLCVGVQVWQSLYKHEEGVKYGMYITTMLLHPKSIGTIRLKGPDPDLEPLIDPKFLHHPDDARTLKEGE